MKLRGIGHNTGGIQFGEEIILPFSFKMAKFFIKINDGKRDWYLHWSTVVDAPTSRGMSYEELKKYVEEKDGENGLKLFDSNSKNFDRTGTSSPGITLDDLLCHNRAGVNETTANKEEILNGFCYDEYLYYRKTKEDYEVWKKRRMTRE